MSRRRQAVFIVLLFLSCFFSSLFFYRFRACVLWSSRRVLFFGVFVWCVICLFVLLGGAVFGGVPCFAPCYIPLMLITSTIVCLPPLLSAATAAARRDRFTGNLQQDAHEFLSDLINVLHEEAQPRLDTAAGYVRNPITDVGGGGGLTGRKTAASGAATGRRADRVTTGQAGISSTTNGGGGGGGDDGNRVMVDLSATDSGDDEQEEPDPYAGGWDEGEAFAIAADAAATAAADAAVAAAAAGSSATTAVEVCDDPDSSSCDDEVGHGGTGMSLSLTPLQTTTTAMAMPTMGLKEGEKGGDEDDKGGRDRAGVGKGARRRGGVSELEGPAGGEKGEREEEEEELALRERERLMPTTRHFHAEIEVCAACIVITQKSVNTLARLVPRFLLRLCH